MSDYIERDVENYLANAKLREQRIAAALRALQDILSPACLKAEHRPLRSPLCRNCQIDARIEEAISHLECSRE
jgi:hypothetical protein